MRSLLLAMAMCALLLLGAAACGDATLVKVGGDLQVPDQLDGICLAASDNNPAGGEFARFYQLGGDLGGLPQSLAVEAGQAQAAEARVRGYLGGVEVARDRGALDFSSNELDLELSRCPGGNRGAAQVAGTAPQAPADAALAASYGRGGTLLLAVGAGDAVTLRASAGKLADAGVTLPDPPAMAPAGLVPFDADGDCDDDVVVLLADAPPVLWRRDGVDTFVAADDAFPATGLDTARAAAAADIDGDGDLDLAIGGSSLLILRNDGSGRFQIDNTAAPPGLDDVTALAFGDVDGDGHVDLVVGQGSSAPGLTRVLLNDSAGTGFFEVAAASLPEVPLQTRALGLADVNGDGARDLVVGALGTNVRLYVNRGDGRLEDRSFVSLPDIDARDVTSLAVADWTADCLTDLVIGVPGGDPISWRGADGEVLVDDGDPGVAGDHVLLVDIDDDGDRDLIVGGPGGVSWVRRQ